MIPRTITASFDAGLAREVGIAAAVLYNALVWVAQSEMVKGYNSDGWFYYTATKFEEETTYTKNSYTAAVKALMDAGYIEKKQKYIKNTSVSVNHYRFLKFYNPDSQKLGTGGFTKIVKPYNKKNNTEEYHSVSAETETRADAEHLSSDCEPKEGAGGVVKITTPFTEPVASVKPKDVKKVVTKADQVRMLADELMGMVMPGKKSSPALRSVVKARLNENYQPEELRLAVRRAMADDKLSEEFGITGWLSGGVIDKLTRKNTNKPRMTKTAELYWG